MAVLALLALLVVKLEFKSPDSNYVFLDLRHPRHGGGLVTMTVAFGFYRDPALVVRAETARTGIELPGTRRGPWSAALLPFTTSKPSSQDAWSPWRCRLTLIRKSL